MQTYGQPKVNYPRYAGNARYTGFSTQFLAAHIGQIASMYFFAGIFTIYELSRYDPDLGQNSGTSSHRFHIKVPGHLLPSPPGDWFWLEPLGQGI